MALFFALGSTCFLIGPFPGYAQLVGANADAVTFFIGSILFTVGGALQTCIAFPERHSRRSGPRGVVGRRDPIRRHPVLQRHHLPGAAHVPLQLPLRQARVAARRVRLDRFLVSGAIAYRASDRHGWLPARGPSRLVGTIDQPARLHLLRHLGHRRLPRPFNRLAAQPSLGELEHRAGSRVLPDLRARDAPDRPHPQVAAAAAPAQARARDRTRR